MSEHIILTPKDCGCIKDPDYNCPICDGGLAVCTVCGKAEIELDQPCIPREKEEPKKSPWYFTIQELYDAAETYTNCTTDEKDNQEVRATVLSFLGWFEDCVNHEPTEEELAAHYKSIAEPYKGAL